VKKILKPYRHLTALFVVVLAAICLAMLGANPVACGLAVGCYQLAQFAMSKGYRRGRVCVAALTDEQVKEFEGILKSFEGYGEMLKDLAGIAKSEGGLAAIKQLPEQLKKEQTRNDALDAQVKKLTKRFQTGESEHVKMVNGVPLVGDQCAKYLGSMFVLKALQDNKLKHGADDPLVAKACEFMGVETKTAIATTDVPLPVAYSNQIIELVYIYGTARKACTVYPLAGNSMKLPRLKTGEPQFAFINISGAVTEKVPQSEFITFTPGKAGGIVRIPSEIEEDSIFDLGQFVARYIAREMAYWEDTCLFLGDGSATYNNISGVGAQATTDSTKLQLAATNSSSDKITLANMRAIRALPTGAVLKTAKYYAHPTMDTLLVSFNTSATVVPYVRMPDGSATFDGFPIVWVPIMPVYSTSATLNAYQVYFGDLSWWYFGVRRAMDVQTSRDVYFATDEVGVRALERFDIHLMGQKASSALQLSAS